MPAPTTYQISLTSSMTDLSALATPVMDPKSPFVPYSQPLQLGDGTLRGGGWKTTTWHWDILTQPERDMLRTFCPGASANVYITTKTTDSDDSFVTFTAVMIWPQNEERDFLRRKSFDIQFRKLVAV